MTHEIVPGILEERQSDLQKKFKTASNLATTIQIDIIDSSFSNNTTNPDLSFTKKYNNQLELHLMTKNPEEWIEGYKNLKIKRVIGHVEHMQNIPKFISICKKISADPFLGIDLPTDIEQYSQKDYLEKGLSGYLIMTVKAGRSGQAFKQESIKKIEFLRNKFKQTDIEVDGGINKDNLPILKKAGANIFAATSAIFTHNPKKSFNDLQVALNK